MIGKVYKKRRNLVLLYFKIDIEIVLLMIIMRCYGFIIAEFLLAWRWYFWRAFMLPCTINDVGQKRMKIYWQYKKSQAIIKRGKKHKFLLKTIAFLLIFISISFLSRWKHKKIVNRVSSHFMSMSTAFMSFARGILFLSTILSTFSCHSPMPFIHIFNRSRQISSFFLPFFNDNNENFPFFILLRSLILL